MNEVKTLKAVSIFFTATLSAWLGPLYVPVMMMVLCNIIDYVTGLMAAKYRQDGKICSYKSIKGIQKKVSMWLLVVVGFVIDQLLLYATDTFGFESPFNCLVACVVAVWITCNELISIIENVKDVGVGIPRFLLPLVKNIQSQTEAIVEDNIDIKEDEENEN